MSVLNSLRQGGLKGRKDKKGFKLETAPSTRGILTEIASACAIILTGLLLSFLMMYGK